MRIVGLSLFAGVAIAVATSPAAFDSRKDTKNEQPSAKVEEGVDQIITGKTLSDRQADTWQERRDKYLNCPECVTNQPFPE